MPPATTRSTPPVVAPPAMPDCQPIPRRAALRTLGTATLALTLGACTSGSSTPRVVLYSSVDDHLLRDLIPIYEAATGVRVDLVGDTEATKSTGLAERIIAERATPRGDVWWSSEPFYSIRLAGGLLEPGAGRAALGESVASRWPPGLIAGDGSWVGLACRARVIVYRAGRIAADQAPRRLADLLDPRWHGRVAMARPEFGTTRGHLAALIEHNGLDATEAWLRAMVAAGLKVYSGNSTVVRAIAQGEADIGLTDTDDVWSGQRNGWDVAGAYEIADPTTPDAPGATRAPGSLASLGPLVLPNTAALIRGGPNPAEGRRLLAWILAGQAERALARSESRNVPVHPDLVDEFPDLPIEPAWRPDLELVASHLDEAAALGARVLDG